MPRDYLPKDYNDLLDLFKQDNLFDPDYVIYDEYGVKQTKCQRCGTVVVHRMSEMIRCVHCNKTFQIETKLLKELPNLVKIEKDLSNGKYVALLSCQECAPYFENLNESEEKRILAQLCYGWAKDLKQSKRPSKDIQNYIDKRVKLKFEKKK